MLSGFPDAGGLLGRFVLPPGGVVPGVVSLPPGPLGPLGPAGGVVPGVIAPPGPLGPLGPPGAGPLGAPTDGAFVLSGFPDAGGLLGVFVLPPGVVALLPLGDGLLDDSLLSQRELSGNCLHKMVLAAGESLMSEGLLLSDDWAKATPLAATRVKAVPMKVKYLIFISINLAPRT